jgi:hypothetical protein
MMPNNLVFDQTGQAELAPMALACANGKMTDITEVFLLEYSLQSFEIDLHTLKQTLDFAGGTPDV